MEKVLKNGDKLQITQSFIDHKQSTLQQGSAYGLGEEWEIDNAMDEGYMITRGLSITYCPYELAIEMHIASDNSSSQGE
jgi:hypothetical protein